MSDLLPPPAWTSTDLYRLPVLSIRQPWAWAILHAGKDIENRNWRTNFRGRFLIHAAKGCTFEEWQDAAWSIDIWTRGAHHAPGLDNLPRGGIVGVAEIVDCVSESDSLWFVGDFGFVLRHVQALEFLPARGTLGFFKLPAMEARA